MILLIACSTGCFSRMSAHFDQRTGERERPDVRQRLIQRVQEHQQELRHRRDRTGDVAQHHHPRLLDALLFPHGDERNAAPAHVPPHRPPRIQLPAQPPPPRLGITRGQLLRHLPHQHAHPIQVAPLEVRQPRATSAVLRETSPSRRARTAAGSVRRSRAPRRAAARPCLPATCARPQRFRRAGLPHRLHVAFQRAQSHAVQDAPRIKVLLREEADVLDAPPRAPPVSIAAASAARSSLSSNCPSDCAARTAHAVAADLSDHAAATSPRRVALAIRRVRRPRRIHRA